MSFETQAEFRANVQALAQSIQGRNFSDIVQGVISEEAVTIPGSLKDICEINSVYGTRTYEHFRKLPQADGNKTNGYKIGIVTDLENFDWGKELKDTILPSTLKEVYSPREALAALKSYRNDAEEGLEAINVKFYKIGPGVERGLEIQESETEIVHKARILLASTSFLHGIAREALNRQDLTLALLCCEAAGDFESVSKFPVDPGLNHGEVVLENIRKMMEEKTKAAKTLELFALKEIIEGIGQRNKFK